MTRLFLIRHGEPEAAWGGDAKDPGLSARGREQAEAAARTLAAAGPLAIISSPMQRCRETAAPFEALRGEMVRIEPRVSEVVAPVGVTDRRAWLGENFPWRDGAGARTWDTLDPALHAWRDGALNAMRELTSDTAVFSHFIAINTIVGAAMKAPVTIACRPDYASITELELRDGVLTLVRLGAAMVDGEVR